MLRVRPMGPPSGRGPKPTDSTEELLYACYRELRSIKSILFWTLVIIPIMVGVYLGLSA